MPRIRLTRLGLPLFAAVLFGFSLWSVAGSGRSTTTTEPPAPSPVSPYPATVAGTGLVEPSSETIAVAIEQGGVVSRVAVVAGETVAAGQPLFAIDDSRVAAALGEAEATRARAVAALATIDRRIALQRAAIEQAEAEVNRSEAEQKRAGLDRTRYSELANQRWVSDQRNETAAADARKADAGVLGARAAVAVSRHELGVLDGTRSEAEASIQQATASVQKARVDLERTVVRSPIDAGVLRVNIRPGEYAQEGVLAQPLMTLGAVGPLHVRVDIDEADAWRVHAGAPATAFLRGNADIRTTLAFVRFEPDLVPKRSLTGSRAERVDTRVLQVIYRFDPAVFPARVGQQVDVHIDAAAPVPLAGPAGAPGRDGKAPL